jgi:hypothetical protein
VQQPILSKAAWLQAVFATPAGTGILGRRVVQHACCYMPQGAAVGVDVGVVSQPLSLSMQQACLPAWSSGWWVVHSLRDNRGPVALVFMALHCGAAPGLPKQHESCCRGEVGLGFLHQQATVPKSCYPCLSSTNNLSPRLSSAVWCPGHRGPSPTGAALPVQQLQGTAPHPVPHKAPLAAAGCSDAVSHDRNPPPAAALLTWACTQGAGRPHSCCVQAHPGPHQLRHCGNTSHPQQRAISEASCLPVVLHCPLLPAEQMHVLGGLALQHTAPQAHTTSRLQLPNPAAD